MSRYSRNHTGFYRLLKTAMIIALTGVVACYAPSVWRYFHQIDGEQILANSELRDKTFSASVQKIEVDGLSAYLLEEHSVPIVSIDFIFGNAGYAHEDEEKLGLTSILARMLTDGAGEYDAQTFKDVCEEYGIRIGFTSGVDDISGYLHTPRQNLDKALHMLEIVLLSPRFEQSYLELRQQQQITAIQMRQENPGAVLTDKYAEIIFAGHPYSHPSLGTKETIAAITTQDLKQYMQQNLSQANLTIGMAGDLSAAEAKDILANVFAKLPAEFGGDEILPIQMEFSGKEYNIKRSSAQAISAFVSNSTNRNSPDYYPLYIANYIFGGSGLNSRLSKVIREENGLTYGIYTSMSETDALPTISGSFSATPDNFRLAQELLLEQWQLMAEHGVSEDELRQAKDALISSYNLRFATIRGIASMMTLMQKFNLGMDFLEKRNDYVKAVTLSEVNAAARKYFSALPDFVNIGIEKEEKN